MLNQIQQLYAILNKLSNIKFMGNISFQHQKRAIFDDYSKQRLVDIRLNMLQQNRRNPTMRKSCIVAPSNVRKSPGSTSTGSRKQSPFIERNYTYKPITSQLNGFRQTISLQRGNSNSTQRKPKPSYHELSATTKSSWMNPQRPSHIYYASPIRSSKPSYVQYAPSVSSKITQPTEDLTTIRPISPPPLQKSRSQIIRKVRNFNDFINAVKKQLDDRLNQEKHLRVLMKLENQSFDIKKYRDIFEKEVNRKHSVKSIDIQQEHPDLKVVDIRLDNTDIKTRNNKTKMSIDEHSQNSMQPSIITRGRSQLQLRLKQTVQQLKHISQLLYDKNQPEKGINISQNIANIRSIMDGSSSSIIKHEQSSHVGNIKSCISHMEYLDEVQNANIRNTKMLLEKYENEGDSKDIEEDD